MKDAISFLLLLPVLALAACAPRATPPPREIIVPKAAPRADLAPSIATAARVASRNESIARNVEQADRAIDSAENSTRQAEAKATAPDLKAFLAETRLQLGIAKAATAAAKKDADEQATAAATLAGQLRETSEALADRDRELEQYRQALPQANATIKDDAKVIEKVPGLIADKASAGVYKHWVIGIAVVLILLAAIFIGLKSIKPI